MENSYFMSEATIDQFYINSNRGIDKFIEYLSMSSAKFIRNDNKITVDIREEREMAVLPSSDSKPGVYSGDKTYEF